MRGIFDTFRTKTSDVLFEEPVPDFIPYACHYDPHTILTKNGELLQIIKVVGFSGEVVGSNQPELRHIVRQAVLRHVKSNNFALWFHTIRCQKNLDPGGYYANEFSYRLNQAWKERHQWDKKYVNELYITIIHDGISVKTADIKGFFYALSVNSLRKNHQQALEKSHAALMDVVDGMLRNLESFGARRLTMVEENDGYYSEPLQFFGKILNLTDTPTPVPVDDLSTYLASHKIAFGFNTMEVKSVGGTKFAAIFTVKDYYELPAWVLDEFLQLSQEFIVMQTIDFINSRAAKRYFKDQHTIFKISGAERLSRLSGIDDIMASDTGSITDYGESQMTVLLISDSIAGLKEDIDRAADVFRRMGILITRRDLRLEECFWAQLPANFAYLSRCKPINTARIGGFASLYNFPAGKHKGNQWGPAVTAFHTIAGTPYFFNFHVDGSGHTTMIGPLGSGKTVLLNFLVSESQKYNGKLFFFDQMRASRVFIKAIGGEYTVIKPKIVSPDYAFNPLQLLSLQDNDEIRDFLTYWLILLVQAKGEPINDREHQELSQAVNYIAALPKNQRLLRVLAAYLEQKNEQRLAQCLAMWHSKGEYAHLFDNDCEQANPLQKSIYGFGMSFVIEDSVTLGPILVYLLQCIEMSLDGLPAVVVLDEAWRLIDNALFAPLLPDWLDRVAAKNAIVIFATESVSNASKSNITSTIIDRIATQIFLPNVNASESSMAYQKIWGLSPQEFKVLSSMDVEKRQFMLRQQGNSVVAVLNLSGLKEVSVLSGSDKTVALMDKAIDRKGRHPEEWLPSFYELVKNPENT